MDILIKGFIFIFMSLLISIVYTIKTETIYYTDYIKPDITITYREPSDIMGRFIKEYLYDKEGDRYLSYKPLVYRGHDIIWYKKCYLEFMIIPYHNDTQINKIIYCENYPNRNYY